MSNSSPDVQPVRDNNPTSSSYPADIQGFFTGWCEAKRYTVQEVIGKGSYGEPGVGCAKRARPASAGGTAALGGCSGAPQPNPATASACSCCQLSASSPKGPNWLAQSMPGSLATPQPGTRGDAHAARVARGPMRAGMQACGGRQLEPGGSSQYSQPFGDLTYGALVFMNPHLYWPLLPSLQASCAQLWTLPQGRRWPSKRSSRCSTTWRMRPVS